MTRVVLVYSFVVCMAMHVIYFTLIGAVTIQQHRVVSTTLKEIYETLLRGKTILMQPHETGLRNMATELGAKVVTTFDELAGITHIVDDHRSAIVRNAMSRGGTFLVNPDWIKATAAYCRVPGEYFFLIWDKKPSATLMPCAVALESATPIVKQLLIKFLAPKMKPSKANEDEEKVRKGTCKLCNAVDV